MFLQIMLRWEFSVVDGSEGRGKNFPDLATLDFFQGERDIDIYFIISKRLVLVILDIL